MLVDIIIITTYFSLGAGIITLTHSLYSHFFHSEKKVFGIPIFGLSAELPSRFGIISSILVFFISVPYITNYVQISKIILNENSALPEVLGLTIPLFIFLFFILQTVGGPSITKGILEFSLFIFTASLIHQSIVKESTQDATLLGMGFVFGLTSVYIGWLSIYIYGEKIKTALGGFFDTSDFGRTADKRLVFVSTIIYFPASSAYIVLVYWISSFLIASI